MISHSISLLDYVLKNMFQKVFGVKEEDVARGV